MMLRFLLWLTQRLPRPRIIWAANAKPYLVRWFLLPWRRPKAPDGGREAFNFWGDPVPGIKWGSGGWNAHLHCFLQGDSDRELHNHPHKWSYSLILWGSYLEEREGLPPRVRRAGSIAKLSDSLFHRVTLISPQVWTLWITGPKTQLWGFRDFSKPGGIRYAQEQWERECEPPSSS